MKQVGKKSRSSSQRAAPGAHLVARLFCVFLSGLQGSV